MLLFQLEEVKDAAQSCRDSQRRIGTTAPSPKASSRSVLLAIQRVHVTMLLILLRLLQFCQPSGWQLSAQKQQATYFVSVLTDIEVDRHYCACLTFFEDVAVVPSQVDEDEEEEEKALGSPNPNSASSVTLVHSARMFAPKSLVLVSKLNYFETFRVRDFCT
jgi:hypothetical protein